MIRAPQPVNQQLFQEFQPPAFEGQDQGADQVSYNQSPRGSRQAERQRKEDQRKFEVLLNQNTSIIHDNIEYERRQKKPKLFSYSKALTNVYLNDKPAQVS